MVLKNKEVTKMSEEAMKDKLKDLRFELSKANVQANKTNAKTKEIKKAIARILTAMNAKSKNTEGKFTDRKSKIVRKEKHN